MGAKQSGQTRTVSMDNVTPVGVIDVSEEVVQRLRSGFPTSKDKQESKKEITGESNVEKPVPSLPRAAVSYPNPYHHPPSISGSPTITAIEVRREKEAELVANDLYWRRRLAQLEETLQKTNSIMEKEYTAAVADVQKRFKSDRPSHKVAPCQTLKAQVISCYRTNPGETLKCSEEVAAFINCVSENRVKILDLQDDETAPTTRTK